MSSIMRARSGLTRRSERLESIGVPLSSRRLLDLQCSGPDAPIVTPYRSPPRRLRTGGDARPSRESGFVRCPLAGIRHQSVELVLTFRPFDKNRSEQPSDQGRVETSLCRQARSAKGSTKGMIDDGPDPGYPMTRLPL